MDRLEDEVGRWSERITEATEPELWCQMAFIFESTLPVLDLAPASARLRTGAGVDSAGVELPRRAALETLDVLWARAADGDAESTRLPELSHAVMVLGMCEPRDQLEQAAHRLLTQLWKAATMRRQPPRSEDVRDVVVPAVWAAMEIAPWFMSAVLTGYLRFLCERTIGLPSFVERKAAAAQARDDARGFANALRTGLASLPGQS